MKYKKLQIKDLPQKRKQDCEKEERATGLLEWKDLAGHPWSYLDRQLDTREGGSVTGEGMEGVLFINGRYKQVNGY